MPAAPAAMEADSFAVAKGAAAAEPPAGQLVQPALRTKFADTALWVAALQNPPRNGTRPTSPSTMPENLTTWRIKVWGMGHGTKVGEAATDVITRKGSHRPHAGAAVLRPER